MCAGTRTRVSLTTRLSLPSALVPWEEPWASEGRVLPGTWLCLFKMPFSLPTLNSSSCLLCISLGDRLKVGLARRTGLGCLPHATQGLLNAGPCCVWCTSFFSVGQAACAGVSRVPWARLCICGDMILQALSPVWVPIPAHTAGWVLCNKAGVEVLGCIAFIGDMCIVDVCFGWKV